MRLLLDIDMATNKKRLNIALSPELEVAIKQLADRDNLSQSSKAAELLLTALEIEEDRVWEKLTRERDKKEARFVCHGEAWA